MLANLDAFVRDDMTSLNEAKFPSGAPLLLQTVLWHLQSNIYPKYYKYSIKSFIFVFLGRLAGLGHSTENFCSQYSTVFYFFDNFIDKTNTKL